MNDTKNKETKQWTKEEILAVKSLKERSRLIAQNMELFPHYESPRSKRKR